jgi:hypothetical protein
MVRSLKPRHLNLSIRRCERSNSRSGHFTTRESPPTPLDRLLPVAQSWYAPRGGEKFVLGGNQTPILGSLMRFLVTVLIYSNPVYWKLNSSWNITESAIVKYHNL